MDGIIEHRGVVILHVPNDFSVSEPVCKRADNQDGEQGRGEKLDKMSDEKIPANSLQPDLLQINGPP